MNLHLHRSVCEESSAVHISGSKSETNRLLLLKAIFPEITLTNTSDSDDSIVMLNALSSNNHIINVEHAGTAMRFLTAYFATVEGREVILTGSNRMKERPISILVDALREMGANITYTDAEGFPPLKIIGTKLGKSQVSLNADVSSQYISALLLIAPKFEYGLELTLEKATTSVPYIKMTLSLLNDIGIKTSYASSKINVSAMPILTGPKTVVVESDWSSASYFYSIVALASIGTKITLSSFKHNSFQGDSALAEIYKSMGVRTSFRNNEITLEKTPFAQLAIKCNFNATPDIAQTVAISCLGLGMECHLSGLHTLKIKETDRLEALRAEISKLGGEITITDDSLALMPCKTIADGVTIKTYGDHRMAMSFAPLALKTSLIIENSDVVSKSYPSFWNDLRTVGFSFSETP